MKLREHGPTPDYGGLCVARMFSHKRFVANYNITVSNGRKV